MNIRSTICICLCWITCSTVQAQRILSTIPDTIFFNGKIITVDPDSNISGAFSVKDGKFHAVGSDTELLSLAGPETELIDLLGHAVIPGLIDNHNHQYHVGLLTLRGVDVRETDSLEQMLQLLRQAVASSTPGETVFTTTGWAPGNYPEQRGPSRAELDAIGPDNPIVVYRSRSNIQVNTAALDVLGITRTDTPIHLIEIDRESNGEPTGLITGQPAAVLNLAARVVPPPSLDEKKELIRRIQAEQHSMGLTGIRDLQLYPDVMRAYFELWREQGLTMRVSIGLELNAGEEDQLDGMLGPWGIGPGFGDEWLRIDGLAEFNPGNLLRDPYSNRDDNYTGDLRLDEDDFIEAIRVINRYGWRPSIHVMGDRTLDLVLDAYEAADRDRSIRDRRWIVEHIPLVHPEQIERMQRLGVMVSAQFQTYRSASSWLRQWGEERTYGAMPIRDLLEAGIIVSGGSDWPDAPNNPFINIYYYVTRDTLPLGPVGVEQSISRQDAIRVMSLNNTYLTFEEDIKGTIEPGKLADFVILSHDILTIPEQEILTLQAIATYVSGRQVYDRPGSPF